MDRETLQRQRKSAEKKRQQDVRRRRDRKQHVTSEHVKISGVELRDTIQEMETATALKNAEKQARDQQRYFRTRLDQALSYLFRIGLNWEGIELLKQLRKEDYWYPLDTPLERANGETVTVLYQDLTSLVVKTRYVKADTWVRFEKDNSSMRNFPYHVLSTASEVAPPEKSATQRMPLSAKQEEAVNKIADQLQSGELTLPLDKTVVCTETEHRMLSEIRAQCLGTTDDDWE